MSYRPARGGAGSDLLQTAPLTVALIVVNVVVYILQARSSNVVVLMDSGTTGGSLPVAGSVDGHYGLWGPMVSSGEWWRLLTSGFLHASPLHLGSNMLALFFIGRAMEPGLGSLRVALIYLVSLAAGSLGVIILQPDALSIGASGAIFGLMGALVVVARSRGISAMESGVGMVILLNLVITFTIPGISIGGHLGGLAGGAAIALVMVELDKRRHVARGSPAPFVAISLAAFAGILLIAVALARQKYPSLS
jgi:membrane associated rhomboid family serine protease